MLRRSAAAPRKPPKMGVCMSSNNDEVEQKKKSQAIDKILEEDSKRLRKECKILLLGKRLHSTHACLPPSSPQQLQ